MKHKEKNNSRVTINQLFMLFVVTLVLFSFVHPRMQARAATPGETLRGTGSVLDAGNIFKEGLVPCGHKDAPPDGSRPDDTCTLTDMFIVAARITNFMVAFSAVFVVFKLVDGGFGLVTAAGNQQSLSAAKDKLTNAFYGFLLVLMAYLIVTAIIYELLQIKGPQDILSNPANYIQTTIPEGK